MLYIYHITCYKYIYIYYIHIYIIYIYTLYLYYMYIIFILYLYYIYIIFILYLDYIYIIFMLYLYYSIVYIKYIYIHIYSSYIRTYTVYSVSNRLGSAWDNPGTLGCPNFAPPNACCSERCGKWACSVRKAARLRSSSARNKWSQMGYYSFSGISHI